MRPAQIAREIVQRSNPRSKTNGRFNEARANCAGNLQDPHREAAGPLASMRPAQIAREIIARAFGVPNVLLLQ